MGNCACRPQKDDEQFVEEDERERQVQVAQQEPVQQKLQISDEERFWVAMKSITCFTDEELQILKENFESATGGSISDSAIDKLQWLELLGQDNSDDGKNAALIYMRVFDKFDSKKNDTIDFQEFVSGLSYFHERAPVDQKIDFAFNLFDLGGDEVIHRSELKQILEPSFSGIFKPEQIDDLVDATFEEFGEAPKEGEEKSTTMSYRKFEEMCQQRPDAISMFTIKDIATRK